MIESKYCIHFILSTTAKLQIIGKDSQVTMMCNHIIYSILLMLTTTNQKYIKI